MMMMMMMMIFPSKSNSSPSSPSSLGHRSASLSLSLGRTYDDDDDYDDALFCEGIRVIARKSIWYIRSKESRSKFEMNPYLSFLQLEKEGNDDVF